MRPTRTVGTQSTGLRVLLIYVILLADIVLNHIFEPPTGGLFTVVILFWYFHFLVAPVELNGFSLELLAIILNLVLFYSLFTGLWLFQAGLYGVLMKKMRFLTILIILVIAVYLPLFIAIRFYRLVFPLLCSTIVTSCKVATVQNYPQLAIWDLPGYFPLYIIHALGPIVQIFLLQLTKPVQDKWCTTLL